MFARLSAFVIWSLVAGAVLFWALRFGASPLQAPTHAVAVDRASPVRGDLARLFGAAPVVAQAAPVEAPSRFKLIGVMAPKSKSAQGSGAYGLALIAIDGKPAKAFAVGASLDSGLVLQSVGWRTASVGSAQGARGFVLELPALPPPSTGVLPPPGSAPVGPTLPAAAGAPAPVLPAGLQPGFRAGAAPVPYSGVAQPQPAPGSLNQLPTVPGMPTPDSPRSQ